MSQIAVAKQRRALPAKAWVPQCLFFVLFVWPVVFLAMATLHGAAQEPPQAAYSSPQGAPLRVELAPPPPQAAAAPSVPPPLPPHAQVGVQVDDRFASGN